MTKVVLTALNNGEFPASLNHTYISLLPKKSNPAVVSDYRSISLYNMVYKLIAKVVANRLKSMLPCIIGDIQSVVSGYQITDNVL